MSDTPQTPEDYQRLGIPEHTAKILAVERAPMAKALDRLGLAHAPKPVAETTPTPPPAATPPPARTPPAASTGNTSSRSGLIEALRAAGLPTDPAAAELAAEDVDFIRSLGADQAKAVESAVRLAKRRRDEHARKTLEANRHHRVIEEGRR